MQPFVYGESQTSVAFARGRAPQFGGSRKGIESLEPTNQIAQLSLTTHPRVYRALGARLGIVCSDTFLRGHGRRGDRGRRTI